MALHRRDFLRGGGALAIGTGLGSHLFGNKFTSETATGPNQSASSNAKRPVWKPPTEEDRQKLFKATSQGRKKAVRGSKGMAICTHPLASAAALDMLELGGNACDALCAASLAQVVLEPHLTTLSGVFSLLYFDAKTGKTSYLNGSANVPDSHPYLKAENFIEKSQILRDWDSAMLCPVPGFWGGVESAVDKLGSLSAQTILAPAIYYARHGFRVNDFLWNSMSKRRTELNEAPQAKEMYFQGDKLLAVGEKLVQRRHADTLERLADEGSDYFYRGEFARNYAKAVQAAGGHVTEQDMAAWKPIWTDAVHSTYRDFEIVGSPSPDFGGQTLVEIMNVIEQFDLDSMGPSFESPELTWRIMELVRRVYAESTLARQTGNMMPVEKAISKDFATQRLEEIFDIRKQEQKSGAGKDQANLPPIVPPGSSHITVVDEAGNVATALHSLMSFSYTTRVFVDGVFASAGLMHLASGMPGKDRRIHARICPNMFLKDNKPVLASGSPSVSLTENIIQNSMNLLDFGIDIESSVHKPRFGGMSMQNYAALAVESDMGEKTIEYLRRKGMQIEAVDPWDWLHGSFDGIYLEKGQAQACGDPRRTAQALAL